MVSCLLEYSNYSLFTRKICLEIDQSQTSVSTFFLLKRNQEKVFEKRVIAVFRSHLMVWGYNHPIMSPLVLQKTN